MIHIAELCIELLQQNDEHYAEVSETLSQSSLCFHLVSILYSMQIFYSIEYLHTVQENNFNYSYFKNIISRTNILSRAGCTFT